MASEMEALAVAGGVACINGGGCRMVNVNLPVGGFQWEDSEVEGQCCGCSSRCIIIILFPSIAFEEAERPQESRGTGEESEESEKINTKNRYINKLEPKN